MGEDSAVAEGYGLLGLPHLPTLSLVSVVSWTRLAQFFQAPPQTGPGHLFPIPTCFSQGTHVNRQVHPESTQLRGDGSSAFPVEISSEAC